jgi:hypothetical protein
MLDTVEPIVLPEAAQDEHLLVCPKCGAEFAPKRRDKKYCSSSCAKAATRNDTRGERRAENKVADEVHYERAMRLAEMVYTTPLTEQLGVMKCILGIVIDEAGLRRILSDPKLLKAHPANDKRLFYGGGDKTISQAASAYTQMFFGVSIQTYLQQARNGTLNENHPVSRRVDHGSVPRLRPIKKVKCWHKPLSREVSEAAEQRFAEDMERVSAVVAEAQAKVDTYIATQTIAAANF